MRCVQLALLMIFTLLISTMESHSQKLPVSKKKKYLAVKGTSTNCVFCGNKINVSEDLYENHKDSVVIVNNHQNTSDLANGYSSSFNRYLHNTTATPHMYIDSKVIYRSNYSYDYIKNVINEASTKPVIAGVSFKYEISDTMITVDLSTQFFEADTGNFWLTVLVLENNVVFNQLGAPSNPHSHQRVLRKYLGAGGNWAPNRGVDIADGIVAQGFIYDYQFKEGIDSSWKKENLRFVALLWERMGTYMIPVAVEDQPNGQGNPNSIEQMNKVESNNEIKVYPNPTSRQINVQSEKKVDSIRLMGVNGQVIIKEDNLSTESTLDVTNLLPGMYFIEVAVSNDIIIRKVLITSN
ncbi:MAG: T9SS type A sorting domain-containing protein [Flavobacteriales bacterium]|nr:T9SS type A sorting domain-containing protein [Flavobacteriales bacterium]